MKIRGFRIELGEIESVLRKIDFIKDSTVIARENESGEKDVYAYLVSDEEINIQKVREEISRMIPNYMVPSYMMKIEKIPVTRSGKVDKRALPNIDIASSQMYVAPRNEVEEKLVKVFSEVLGLTQVAVKDNFFELGGDSLKAIRVTSKMKLQGYNIKVKDSLISPSIEQISKSIIKTNGNDQEKVSIR